MLTKDDVYAYALSKTLTKVSSPATVGLYSTCQSRINMILKHIEVYMEQEASRTEQQYKGRSKPRPAKLSLGGFLAVIGRLLFYKPVWTEENQGRQNVRFIYVHFSAWHFAGSDLLWAGLVIRLLEAMQESFGKLPLILYRVAQHDEEEEIKEKIVEDGLKEWRSKKFCCLPLWLLFLALLLIVVVMVVLLVMLGFPKVEAETAGDDEAGESQPQVNVVEGLAIAALGVPAAGILRFTFLLGKNLILNNNHIRRGMDNERISNQLGFMNEVKKEMWLLCCFVHFMEVFERRRIRVVLKITNLDRCSPKKIVGVLDAINILLSDEDSPFISMLAVNPEVLIQQVNFADGCFSKEDRAYAFLNRIVTLSFTVPPLCDISRRKVFYNLTQGHSEMTGDIQRRGNKQMTRDITHPSINEYSMEQAQTTIESNIPLIDRKHIKQTAAALELREDEVERLINSAFESILGSHNNNLDHYVLDDSMSMRRVINSIRVTAVIMEAMKTELPPPEHIAAWVVLANYWPCRLSWILQCIEDYVQRAEIDAMNQAPTDKSKTLWQVFSESRAELYLMRDQIEDLLDQDGDPEMFEMFLRVDFPFTINDVETFKLSTVNLDNSIRKELSQIRGVSRLKDCGIMRTIAPLPIQTRIKLSVEDVCEELKKLDFPEKYADIVKSNHLDGLALVFGDADDLKLLLQMTFGEWTSFRMHFLGFASSFQPRQVSHHHPRKQQLRATHLAHHLSTHSLVTS